MATVIRHNEAASRYEISVNGDLVGRADYVMRGDTAVFPHTEIATAMRGRGLGEELVRFALDDQRSRGRKVSAQCWFVAQFVREHPEYRDLAA
jgi:predicted GNAT family acetyltransferase